MNKKILIQDLADGLALRKGLIPEDAELFVRAVFDVIEEYLQTDKIVKVKGLGTFKLVSVDSRESIDVNTGERIVLKEYTKISFTPDSVLRDSVNKPFAQFETVVLYEGTDVGEMERMDEIVIADKTMELGGSEGNDQFFEHKDGLANSDTNSSLVKDKHVTDNEFLIESSAIEDSSVLVEKGLMVEVEEDISENDINNVPAAADLSHMRRKGEEDEFPDDTNEKADADVISEKDIKTEQDDNETKFVGEEESDVSMSAVQGLSKVHVDNQQIEVQKVEHQTVENQHIVHVVPENIRRRVYLTPWMIFFIVLLVLLLMFISYYVGYHHLFVKKRVEVLQSEITVHNGATKDKSTQLTLDVYEDSVSTVKADTVMQLSEKERKSQEAIDETEEQKKYSKKESADIRRNNEEYPQIKNGMYEIVGTREEHYIKSGETLRGLALRYYGSRDLATYIVVYNSIPTPDIVPEGMCLKIPELKLKGN